MSPLKCMGERATRVVNGLEAPSWPCHHDDHVCVVLSPQLGSSHSPDTYGIDWFCGWFRWRRRRFGQSRIGRSGRADSKTLHRCHSKLILLLLLILTPFTLRGCWKGC